MNECPPSPAASDVVSINLFQSSPDEPEDDSESEQAVSPATQTLTMLSSQLLSQEELMYDHSQRHVDSARVREKQKEWTTVQQHAQTNTQPQQSTVLMSSVTHTDRIEATTAKTQNLSQAVTDDKKTSSKQLEESKKAACSDDDTVDPDDEIAWKQSSVSGSLSRVQVQPPTIDVDDNLLVNPTEKMAVKAGTKTEIETQRKHHNVTPIAQVDPETQEIIAVFVSMSKAADAMEKVASKKAAYRAKISRIASGTQQVLCPRGYCWKFVDRDGSPIETKVTASVETKKAPSQTKRQRLDSNFDKNKRAAKRRKDRRIAQIRNGKILAIFSSYADAASALERIPTKKGTYRKRIGEVVDGKTSICSKGFFWKILDENESVDTLLATTPKVSTALEVQDEAPTENQNEASTDNPTTTARSEKNVSFAPTSKTLEHTKSLTTLESSLISADRSLLVVTPQNVLTPPSDVSLLFGGYKIVHLNISESGALGMHVAQEETPQTLLTALESSETVCCRIYKVVPAGLAAALGFVNGDILIQRMPDSSFQLWDYHAFVAAVRSSKRPLTVHVARMLALGDTDMESASALLALQNPQSQNSATPEENREKNVAETVENASQDPIQCATKSSKPFEVEIDPNGRVASQNSDSQDGANQENDHGKLVVAPTQKPDEPFGVEIDLYSGIVPFCKLCSGGNVREHHSWCPENPHFYHNNAEKIMERIRKGVELGCPVCKEEYQNGKRSTNGDHSETCKAAQSRRKKSSCGKRKRGTQQVAKDDKNKPCKSQAISKGSVDSTKKTVNNGSTTSTAPSSRASGSKKGSKKEAAAMTTAGVKSKQIHITDKPTGKAKTTISSNWQVTAAYYQSYWDADPPSNMDVTEVAWVPCDEAEDPWGFEGYEDGDVVIWACKRSLGHYETVLPSRRFECNPFNVYPAYHRTHTAPSKGLHVLILRRDPPCKQGWGFEWKRHDFGGACLVTRVDSYSPANASTFLGQSSHGDAARLCVNDMLLALNGRSIGGMTMEAFRVELEVCGAEMQLSVSRYRQSCAESRIEQAEQRLICEVDRALNDKHNLDWIDGLGSTVDRPSHAAEAKGSGDSHGCGIHRAPDVDKSDNYLIRPLDSDKSTHKELIVLETQNEGIATRELEPIKGGIADPSSSPNCPIRPPLKKSLDQSEAACSHVNGSTDLGEHSASTHTREEAFVSSKDDDSDEDDVDVANGCICGVTHKSLPVFWIQCDGCEAWYCNAEKCMGMTREEAESADRWHCFACDEATKETDYNTSECGFQTEILSKVSDVHEHETSGNMEATLTATKTPALVSHAVRCETKAVGCSKESKSSETDSTSDEVFETHAIVYITEHAWPGVDNPAGIAKVVSSFLDEDGNRLYNIKYIVGGSHRKNVEQKYIRRHNWDHPSGW